MFKLYVSISSIIKLVACIAVVALLFSPQTLQANNEVFMEYKLGYEYNTMDEFDAFNVNFFLAFYVFYSSRAR